MVLLPSDQLTLTEKARLRAQARDKGLERAVNLKVQPTFAQLDYRQAQNIADFATAGREQWLTATLALVNTQYSVWTTLVAPLVGLTPQLANNKLCVFWGVALNTTPNPVSLLSFRLGLNAATTYAVVNLEDLESQVTPEGYFSEPVVYDPSSILNVVVTSKIATGAQLLTQVFHHRPLSVLPARLLGSVWRGIRPRRQAARKRRKRCVVHWFGHDVFLSLVVDSRAGMQFDDLECRDPLHVGRAGYSYCFAALNVSLQAAAKTPFVPWAASRTEARIERMKEVINQAAGPSAHTAGSFACET